MENEIEAMDKAMEAAARALSPHLRFYGDGHGHAVTIADKTIKAFLAALEAAGVRLVPSEATHKMADVGTEARWQSAVRDANNVREIWRAMLAASPYALKETGQ